MDMIKIEWVVKRDHNPNYVQYDKYIVLIVHCDSAHCCTKVRDILKDLEGANEVTNSVHGTELSRLEKSQDCSYCQKHFSSCLCAIKLEFSFNIKIISMNYSCNH